MTVADNRWIQTFSGRAFWPLNPSPADVDIYDIAHALACNNRFNGHTRTPYSVAQHSVLVSQVCDDDDALAGLLHDASEAYIHDIVRPIKSSIQVEGQPYEVAEERVMRTIFGKYGLSLPLPESVVRADNVLLVTEKRDLMAPCDRKWHEFGVEPLHDKIVPWEWHTARTIFLTRFFQLMK